MRRVNRRRRIGITRRLKLLITGKIIFLLLLLYMERVRLLVAVVLIRHCVELATKERRKRKRGSKVVNQAGIRVLITGKSLYCHGGSEKR